MVFITIVTGANLNQLISWGPHIVGMGVAGMIITSDGMDHSRKFPAFSTSKLMVIFFHTCLLKHDKGGYKLAGNEGAPVQ